MKTLRAVALTIALVSCTGTDATHTPEPMPTGAQGDPTLHAAVMRDLSLRLSLTGPAVVDANGDWPLAVALENRGGIAHQVVMSHDGSDVGWREPHVFYSVEVREASGAWVPAQAQDVMRCGNYASDWRRDVTELAGGASLALEDFTPPSYSFDIEQSARVRVRAHYAWDGGSKRSFAWNRDVDAEPEPDLPHELRAVGPYELVSNAIELDAMVDRPIDIALSVRAPRIAKGAHRTQMLFDAIATSISAKDEDLGSDEIISRFWLEGKKAGDHTRMMIELTGPTKLAPGQRATLAVREPRDTDFDEPGRWQLRVRYEALASSPARTSHVRKARSPWVDVEVMP